MIRIQSKVTIHVSRGLDYDDYTKKDSDIPNRLKISPKWPKSTICITAGVGEYPDEIAEWDAVKSLERDGILTISTLNNVEETPKKGKKGSLADIAEED